MRTTDFTTMERGFWLQGGAYFTANCTQSAWFIMPDPIGLVGLDGALRRIASGTRWSWVDMDDTRVEWLGADAVVLVYRARARRTDEPPYEALCSSSYVRHRRRWRLVHHQQTPVGTARA